jgi:hypothetical protein
MDRRLVDALRAASDALRAAAHALENSATNAVHLTEKALNGASANIAEAIPIGANGDRTAAPVKTMRNRVRPRRIRSCRLCLPTHRFPLTRRFRPIPRCRQSSSLAAARSNTALAPGAQGTA